MKYSRLVKLAHDTQAPQMRKQAAPSGRDIAITAGSGALSGLAGYAMARLLGAGNKKALGIGAGAGVAGAGLGYAGSAYGAQIAEGVKGRLARSLSAEQKDTTISNLKDKISEGVGRAGQSLKSAGRTVTQKISDLVDEVSAPKPEPEPVIQDADENEAKSLLESFSNGATIYSIKNGGNGKDHFPVSPEQFERFVPRIYYMALVKNNDVASANPAGGYIVKYMPNEDGTHFKFRAFPSQVKYYRGKSFVMTDNMEITPEQK
jgi:hypothetical protein